MSQQQCQVVAIVYPSERGLVVGVSGGGFWRSSTRLVIRVRQSCPDSVTDIVLLAFDIESLICGELFELEVSCMFIAHSLTMAVALHHSS